MSLMKLALYGAGGYFAACVVDEYVHPFFPASYKRMNILRVLKEPKSGPNGTKALGDKVHTGDLFDTQGVQTGTGAFTALTDALPGTNGAVIQARANVPSAGTTVELVAAVPATSVTKIF